MDAHTGTATAPRQRATPLAGPLDLASRHALLLIVAAGAIIRFATLGSQGFWIDEHLEINTLRQPASELLPTVMSSETNPPLYDMVAKAWQAVFGLGEVGLRSLSALAGTATIPVVYAAGLALGSRRAGLFAAALTATSPFMIWYSQEARPYALFALLAALAFLCFVQALQGRRVRWLWAWAIASILACSTHYFGILLTGIEAAWLLWALRDSRPDVALSIGAICAASVPLVLLGMAQEHLTGWIGGFEAGDRLVEVPQHLIVGLSSPWEILPPVAVAVVLAVVLYVIATSTPESLRIAVVPAGVALAVGAVTVIALIAGSDYLTSRNLIGSWTPFVLALGAVLAAPAARVLGAATISVLCVVGVALAIWTAATPAAARPDWEPVATALGPAEVPRAITYSSPFVVPLIHDLPNAYEPAPGGTATVQEIALIEPRAVPDYSVGPCSSLGVCSADSPVPSPGEFGLSIPPGFELVDEGQTSLFTYRRYRRSRPYELPPAPTFGNRVIVQPQS
jgi:4-amino-4-deoxy-L-arabinose transferase-like glycosyltransferase